MRFRKSPKASERDTKGRSRQSSPRKTRGSAEMATAKSKRTANKNKGGRADKRGNATINARSQDKVGSKNAAVASPSTRKESRDQTSSWAQEEPRDFRFDKSADYEEPREGAASARDEATTVYDPLQHLQDGDEVPTHLLTEAFIAMETARIRNAGVMPSPATQRRNAQGTNGSGARGAGHSHLTVKPSMDDATDMPSQRTTPKNKHGRASPRRSTRRSGGGKKSSADSLGTDVNADEANGAISRRGGRQTQSKKPTKKLGKAVSMNRMFGSRKGKNVSQKITASPKNAPSPTKQTRKQVAKHQGSGRTSVGVAAKALASMRGGKATRKVKTAKAKGNAKKNKLSTIPPQRLLTQLSEDAVEVVDSGSRVVFIEHGGGKAKKYSVTKKQIEHTERSTGIVRTKSTPSGFSLPELKLNPSSSSNTTTSTIHASNSMREGGTWKHRTLSFNSLGSTSRMRPLAKPFAVRSGGRMAQALRSPQLEKALRPISETFDGVNSIKSDSDDSSDQQSLSASTSVTGASGARDEITASASTAAATSGSVYNFQAQDFTTMCGADFAPAAAPAKPHNPQVQQSPSWMACVSNPFGLDHLFANDEEDEANQDDESYFNFMNDLGSADTSTDFDASGRHGQMAASSPRSSASRPPAIDTGMSSVNATQSVLSSPFAGMESPAWTKWIADAINAAPTLLAGGAQAEAPPNGNDNGNIAINHTQDDANHLQYEYQGQDEDEDQIQAASHNEYDNHMDAATAGVTNKHVPNISSVPQGPVTLANATPNAERGTDSGNDDQIKDDNVETGMMGGGGMVFLVGRDGTTELSHPVTDSEQDEGSPRRRWRKKDKNRSPRRRFFGSAFGRSAQSRKQKKNASNLNNGRRPPLSPSMATTEVVDSVTNGRDTRTKTGSPSARGWSDAGDEGHTLSSGSGNGNGNQQKQSKQTKSNTGKPTTPSASRRRRSWFPSRKKLSKDGDDDHKATNNYNANMKDGGDNANTAGLTTNTEATDGGAVGAANAYNARGDGKDEGEGTQTKEGSLAAAGTSNDVSMSMFGTAQEAPSVVTRTTQPSKTLTSTAWTHCMPRPPTLTKCGSFQTAVYPSEGNGTETVVSDIVETTKYAATTLVDGAVAMALAIDATQARTANSRSAVASVAPTNTNEADTGAVASTLLTSNSADPQGDVIDGIASAADANLDADTGADGIHNNRKSPPSDGAEDASVAVQPEPVAAFSHDDAVENQHAHTEAETPPAEKSFTQADPSSMSSSGPTVQLKGKMKTSKKLFRFWPKKKSKKTAETIPADTSRTASTKSPAEPLPTFTSLTPTSPSSKHSAKLRGKLQASGGGKQQHKDSTAIINDGAKDEVSDVFRSTGLLATIDNASGAPNDKKQHAASPPSESAIVPKAAPLQLQQPPGDSTPNTKAAIASTLSPSSLPPRPPSPAFAARSSFTKANMHSLSPAASSVSASSAKSSQRSLQMDASIASSTVSKKDAIDKAPVQGSTTPNRSEGTEAEPEPQWYERLVNSATSFASNMSMAADTAADGEHAKQAAEQHDERRSVTESPNETTLGDGVNDVDGEGDGADGGVDEPAHDQARAARSFSQNSNGNISNSDHMLRLNQTEGDESEAFRSITLLQSWNSITPSSVKPTTSSKGSVAEDGTSSETGDKAVPTDSSVAESSKNGISRTSSRVSNGNQSEGGSKRSAVMPAGSNLSNGASQAHSVHGSQSRTSKGTGTRSGAGNSNSGSQRSNSSRLAQKLSRDFSAGGKNIITPPLPPTHKPASSNGGNSISGSTSSRRRSRSTERTCDANEHDMEPSITIHKNSSILSKLSRDSASLSLTSDFDNVRRITRPPSGSLGHTDAGSVSIIRSASVQGKGETDVSVSVTNESAEVVSLAGTPPHDDDDDDDGDASPRADVNVEKGSEIASAENSQRNTADANINLDTHVDDAQCHDDEADDHETDAHEIEDDSLCGTPVMLPPNLADASMSSVSNSHHLSSAVTSSDSSMEHQDSMTSSVTSPTLMEMEAEEEARRAAKARADADAGTQTDTNGSVTGGHSLAPSQQQEQHGGSHASVSGNETNTNANATGSDTARHRASSVTLQQSRAASSAGKELTMMGVSQSGIPTSTQRGTVTPSAPSTSTSTSTSTSVSKSSRSSSSKSNTWRSETNVMSEIVDAVTTMDEEGEKSFLNLSGNLTSSDVGTNGESFTTGSQTNTNSYTYTQDGDLDNTIDFTNGSQTNTNSYTYTDGYSLNTYETDDDSKTVGMMTLVEQSIQNQWNGVTSAMASARGGGGGGGGVAQQGKEKSSG